jgi:acetolactate synthase-1/2/3 large subunit
MNEGRPGPVWIDIPLDVQAALVDPHELSSFLQSAPVVIQKFSQEVDVVMSLISKASRPVVLAGHGVHLAKADDAFRTFVEKTRIPALTTWTAADLLDDQHPQCFGRPGMVASRAANFTIQNADLLLVFGSRLDFSITGFDRTQFARAATIVIVDIDRSEIEKLGDLPDIGVVCDAKIFLDGLNNRISLYGGSLPIDDWIERCCTWKQRYPAFLGNGQRN